MHPCNMHAWLSRGRDRVYPCSYRPTVQFSLSILTWVKMASSWNTVSELAETEQRSRGDKSCNRSNRVLGQYMVHLGRSQNEALFVILETRHFPTQSQLFLEVGLRPTVSLLPLQFSWAFQFHEPYRLLITWRLRGSTVLLSTSRRGRSAILRLSLRSPILRGTTVTSRLLLSILLLSTWGAVTSRLLVTAVTLLWCAILARRGCSVALRWVLSALRAWRHVRLLVLGIVTRVNGSEDQLDHPKVWSEINRWLGSSHFCRLVLVVFGDGQYGPANFILINLLDVQSTSLPTYECIG